MAKKTDKKAAVTRKQTITKVAVNNFMGIEAVEFEPKGSTIIVQGNNDQGKSSLLTFLRSALGGKYEFPAMPVRKGADAAKGEIELQDLRVTWEIPADSDKHKMEIFDLRRGKKVAGAPQSLLKRLFGTFALQPMKFDELEPAEQIKFLNKVMVDDDGNPIDLAEFQKEYQALYDARSELNRARKSTQGALEANEPVDDAPEHEIDVAAVAKDLRASEEAKRKRDEGITRARSALHDIELHGEGLARKVDELKEQLARAERELKECDKGTERAREAVTLAEAVEDNTAAVNNLQTTLDEAGDANARWADQQRHIEAREAWQKAEDAYNEKHTELEEFKAAHDERLQKATMPVKELEWKDNQLWYKGVPLKQNSMRNRITVYWHLALAENPDMPIVFFDDANRLDDEARKYISELSAKHEAQTFLVMVGENIEGAQLTMRNGKGIKA